MLHKYQLVTLLEFSRCLGWLCTTGHASKVLASGRIRGILKGQGFEEYAESLSESSGGRLSLVTSSGRQLPPAGEPSRPVDRQRQRLILALILFLGAIGVVVYKSSTSVTAPPRVESISSVPTTSAAPVTPVPDEATNSATKPGVGTELAASHASPHTRAPHTKSGTHGADKTQAASRETANRSPTVVRKVLPPLAVEVFAGGRPVPLPTKPTASVHVDTSGGVEGRALAPGDTSAPAGADGAGRVRISAEALQVLSHPVDPNYPMLAREMKVQGSVILDAFIGKDGSIQTLKIVSGPTILATAAMEAVRQWRFKPYMQAGQAVETEARITVNFTISTT